MTKDRRLGRGLAALLGTPLEGEAGMDGLKQPLTAHDMALAASAATPAATAREAELDPSAEGLLRLSVQEIDDNPFQPRRDFDEPEIATLAESLQEHDMLQPILVRRHGARYQLISGERRLRAARLAGWTTVPARIREADDRLVAELAIVENLQRKDLNPIEKALSFKHYLDEHHCTQDELAKRLKIDRSTVANLMRLLELPEAILQAVRAGRVSAGHARALLPLGDETQQVALSDKIQREGISVREIERIVGEMLAKEDSPQAVAGKISPRRGRPRNPQILALEEEFRRALGSKVEIKTTRTGRGRLIVHFRDTDEFERLRDQLVDPLPQRKVS